MPRRPAPPYHSTRPNCATSLSSRPSSAAQELDQVVWGVGQPGNRPVDSDPRPPADGACTATGQHFDEALTELTGTRRQLTAHWPWPSDPLLSEG